MRNTDHVRATHTGSLPRPEALTKLKYEQIDGADVDADQLAASEYGAVVEALRQQREAGIDVASDGEMTKSGFVNYLADRLSGFSGAAPPFSLSDLEEFPELLIEQYGGEAGAHVKLPVCTGPVSYSGHDAVAADLALFRRALAETGPGEAFVPATSPGLFALMVPDQHYGDYESYLFAIARALREEYRAIVDAGFTLQIDSPDIPIANHMTTWATVLADRGFDGFVDLHLAAVNEAVGDLPRDKVRLHLCWGNYVGPHHMDPPLIDILRPALRANVGGLSFEAANPRHAHEWTIFSELEVPDDKVLLPGVIDTKTNVVEHPELVSQRIQQFARFVGRERVVPGTDCGFGTFVGFGTVLPKVCWMKLASLGEGARLASRALWP
jgi:5-methyltetrahydropteroyltriglutamate--homocysteine methyltransferase